ncbi:hypothetical protein QOZ80_8BG0641610 [Eleusine coracana subsp. coracana]|nr:hypothetical protein QOZ80_8BG0641610 [Eleusine coracana subsp. coracana]
MATKLDQSSAAESPQAKPSLPPKLSMFGTKAGFVIPKNKLAGSLVIRGSTTKNETPTVYNEEHKKHVQRKTKWAPDLSLEPAVCKGRALAYQIRLDQITKQLKSGAVKMGKIEGSLTTAEGSNYDDVDSKENEGKVQHLEHERQEIIGEMLRLNPGYKAPDDYKPILKETKIPLQVKAHSGHSVIGVLIGPESNTQKRLQEETGAIIRVYGTKKIDGEKNEICHGDMDEAQAAYEDLHVNVSADSYDKVDAAVALIDLLLAPISVNSAAISTTSPVSSAVTSDAVNPVDMQLVQSNSSQPGLVHYQSHNDHWISAPQTNVPSLPSSVPVSSSFPNNSFQPPISSFSIPPYTGQPPHMNTLPRNPLPGPGPLPLTPNIQQPPPQFRSNPSVGPPYGQPPGTGPQPTPSSSVPPPVRPLQAPHASGGWPSFSPVTSQSPRPPQASPSFMPVRPPISVSPLDAISPQGPIAMAPPSNTPAHYRSHHPQVASFNPSVMLLSMPPAQSFPAVPPQGPSTMQVLPFPAGASAHSPSPLPMQMRPMMPTPDTVRGPSPAFSQVGPTPGMAPSSIGSSCPPPSAPVNTNCSQASGAAWRPPRSAAGDFTFRPVLSPSPTPDYAASGNQMGMHGSKNPGVPHAPFFRQSLQRPLDGRPMSQPWMHAPPPHLAGAFPRNQFPAGFHPAIQPGGQIISLPTPPASDLTSFLPSRPFQLVPRPQQNPFASMNRQGANPIYDPFGPTETTGAKKIETDAEYEDLMASVGVK